MGFSSQGGTFTTDFGSLEGTLAWGGTFSTHSGSQEGTLAWVLGPRGAL